MVRKTKSEKIFTIFNILLLLFISLIMLYPFWNIMAKSFSSNKAILDGDVYLWPVDFSFFGYKEIFESSLVRTGLINSTIITVSGTLFSMAITISVAYSLSREELVGRKFIFFIFFFTMLFHGGIISMFLVMKFLGLLNTLAVLILSPALNIFYMIIMRSYFEQVPKELIDSATIDGCNEFQTLIRIILPVSKPVLATIALFYAVDYWNIFREAIIFITDSNKYTIQLVLKQLVYASAFAEPEALANYGGGSNFSLQEYGSETLKMAAVFIGTLPILCIYPFLQKYFAKGVLLGAIKG